MTAFRQLVQLALGTLVATVCAAAEPDGYQGESGNSIPDTMGAVGPNHFMVILNGQYSVAVYNKYNGTRLSPTSTTADDFFAVTVSSGDYAGTYPMSGPVDPRIIYDHGSQRWIACALDAGSDKVLLAISHGPDPFGNGGSTWVSDNWTKYLVPLGSACAMDYDTRGTDSNGIYISAVRFGCGLLVKVAALPKGAFLDGSASVVQDKFILDVTGLSSANVHPAVNFDPITTDDSAWFICTTGNVLRHNRLKWVHGFTAAPEWQSTNPFWDSLSISPSIYLLELGAIAAPQLGPTNRVRLAWQGSRLMMAMVRKIAGTQYLWTCHQVGVNSAGNNDNPPKRHRPGRQSRSRLVQNPNHSKYQHCD